MKDAPKFPIWLTAVPFAGSVLFAILATIYLDEKPPAAVYFAFHSFMFLIVFGASCFTRWIVTRESL